MTSTVQTQVDFREIWNLFKETDKRSKETYKQLDRLFKETNKQFKETDKTIREMGKKIDKAGENLIETQKMVGNLSNRWGEFVEGMVKPGMLRMFQYQNINIEQVYERCVSHKNFGTMEIDLLGIDGPHVVVVEVKSKLTMKGVRSFIKKLAEFKQFFPGYSDKHIIGAVAGITIVSNVSSFAYDKGLFVIGQAGEGVNILNNRDFKPKFW